MIRSKLGVACMILNFFGTHVRQCVITGYVPEHGKTVTGNTSVQQIKNPRKAIKAKRRHKLMSDVLLMQGNTPSQYFDVISIVWL